MPIIKSAIKRAKQTIVRRTRNQNTKKDIRLALKDFQAKPTAASLSKLQSAIDTAVKKNVLDPRTAARRKASISKQAKEAGVKLASGIKKAKAAPAKKPAAKATKPVAKAAAKPAAKPTVKKAPAKKPAAKKTTKK
ncbi:MAG: 30S ribosomal protein S20 [Candidatus Saccharimonadales bacterium]